MSVITITTSTDETPDNSAEVDVDSVTHWGCRLPGGVVRWNPGYGRGNGYEEPYTEAQARNDAARHGGEVVSRTETTVVITQPWVVVPDGASVEAQTTVVADGVTTRINR